MMARSATRKWVPAASSACEMNVRSIKNRVKAPMSKPFYSAGDAEIVSKTGSLTARPMVRKNVRIKTADVGRASQAGTLFANIKPAKAVVARRSALSLNACSKGMGKVLDLGCVQDAVGRYQCERAVGVGPGDDGDCVSALGVVR